MSTETEMSLPVCAPQPVVSDQPTTAVAIPSLSDQSPPPVKPDTALLRPTKRKSNEIAGATATSTDHVAKEAKCDDKKRRPSILDDYVTPQWIVEAEAMSPDSSDSCSDSDSINIDDDLATVTDPTFFAALLKIPRLSNTPNAQQTVAFRGTLVDLPFANRIDALGHDAFHQQALLARAMLSTETPSGQSMLNRYQYKEWNASGLSPVTESSLASNRPILIYDVPTEPTPWSVAGVCNTFGLQKLAMVPVSKDPTSPPELLHLAAFFRQTLYDRWSIEQLPVQENHLPVFANSIDHGYRFGWSYSHIKNLDQDLPRSIERQHSWISLLTRTSLKADCNRDPLDGQATLLFVQEGSIFLQMLNKPFTHIVRSRRDLHEYPALVVEEQCILRKGQMIVIPPGMEYTYYALSHTIISGRYFWNYNTMHLTEATRTVYRFSVTKYPYASEDARAAYVTMCRMLAILPYTDFSPTAMHVKPMHALCAMALYAHRYANSAIDPSTSEYLQDMGTGMDKYASALAWRSPSFMTAKQIQDEQPSTLHQLAVHVSLRILRGHTVTFPYVTADSSKPHGLELHDHQEDYLFKPNDEHWYNRGACYTENTWLSIVAS